MNDLARESIHSVAPGAMASSIIHFSRLERDSALLAQAWRAAKPFEHVIIDEFGDPDKLLAILQTFPNLSQLKRSRDYIFAREKYEKNQFAALSPLTQQLREELLSDRFRTWLRAVTGIDLFLDPDFLGGGLHIGGPGSFLDMHADFNVHPLNSEWVREVNILLYLNPGWEPEWGGSLKLRHSVTGEQAEIAPLFNRCVIMLTKDHTLHGYDAITFPQGRFRCSIAAYGYSLMVPGQAIRPRSTAWKPDGSRLRSVVAPFVLPLVRWKNRLFGIGSARNR
ncbi:2OG-Fe(II) oxygenase [Thermaurantiacus tibetensis]|uniref:2OG-Fe(II) oxygenase n=1 Tax=Thermaurantiacus tibetensis TaxID=2759035 RepID=UPI00188EDE0F|nr:2OG-Fe(II) oxygenase [Thermaurantiacus tibetensis]